MKGEKILAPTFEKINKRFEMSLEGDPRVFKSLFSKKEMLEAGNPEHSKIRPLLIAMPGTMRGVVGGAQVTALNHGGLTSVFDNAIGISAGAPDMLYFLTGQAGIGTTIFYEELAENNFISLKRGLMGGDVADIDFLCDVFNGKVGNKDLDKELLLESRTRAHIFATEYDTGRPTMFTVDGSVDPVELIRASAAIPVFYKKPVFINGKRYVDGVASMSMPSREVIDHFDPTDILVLANRKIDTEESVLAKIAESLLFRNFPEGIKKGMRESNSRMLHHLNQLRSDIGRRYVIVWSDDIKTNEMDPEKLRIAASDAYEHMMEALRVYGK